MLLSNDRTDESNHHEKILEYYSKHMIRITHFIHFLGSIDTTFIETSRRFSSFGTFRSVVFYCFFVFSYYLVEQFWHESDIFSTLYHAPIVFCSSSFLFWFLLIQTNVDTCVFISDYFRLSIKWTVVWMLFSDVKVNQFVRGKHFVINFHNGF